MQETLVMYILRSFVTILFCSVLFCSVCNAAKIPRSEAGCAGHGARRCHLDNDAGNSHSSSLHTYKPTYIHERERVSKH